MGITSGKGSFFARSFPGYMDYALDIARAMEIVATASPMQGEVYNLACGRETTVAELADLILSTLALNCWPEFDGIVPAGTPLNWRADISRLGALGFHPEISLEQGVKAFAEWCRAELMRT
jgi:UDP-glucose 4-epimerase